MTDLDKAREWAERRLSLNYSNAEQTQAAAEIIQSLPDHWVDAEKLREVVSKYEGNTYISEIVQDFADLLPAPKLPTLAELIKQGNDPEQYRWMQAKVFHTEELGCITNFDLYGECATVLFPNGVAKSVPYEDITPLPGEPKLEWPGSEATVSNEEIVADDQAVAKDVCNSESNSSETPKSSIKPEDVPANEPWLIEANGTKAIGTRYKGDAVLPWFVAALDGSFADDYHDSVVTLIHKLVPEPPALPEGMRLADHETYGRVVVSPGVDTDGDHKFLRSDSINMTGASWGYANKSKLTFLDGGN